MAGMLVEARAAVLQKSDDEDGGTRLGQASPAAP
jgi:hypothetical protein